MLEDVFGRPLFEDFAAVDEDDAVGNLAGEAHLVRDDDHRHAFCRQLLHDGEHLADHLGVEGACRFVKQHDLRLHAERADDGDTLLLAAGQLRRICPCAVGKTDAAEQLHRLFFGVCLGLLKQFGRRKRHIAQDGHMREEVEMLEHHAHLAAVQIDVHLGIGDIDAVKLDGAVSRRFQQVQRPQQRGFARAGGSDDDDDLAAANLRIHAVERLNSAALIVNLESFYADQCFVFIAHWCAASFRVCRPPIAGRRPPRGRPPPPQSAA